MLQNNQQTIFGVSDQELKILLEQRTSPRARPRIMLALIGAFLSPITFAGVLLGYVRGYNRFQQGKDVMPEFYQLPRIMKLAMVFGAVFIWVALIGASWIAYQVIQSLGLKSGIVYSFLGVNLLLCSAVYTVFRYWRNGIRISLLESTKYGSAREARESELEPFRGRKGMYIGGGLAYDGKFHALTVAGTRGGKGVNLVLPNLLGASDYNTSWVVVDPKGENAAISVKHQRAKGQKIVLLNPWNLLEDKLGLSNTYNPLDLISDKSSIHLADDCALVAELIIPIDHKEREKFFSDNARAILTGLLVHLVTSQKKKDISLKTIWEWIRLPKEQFRELIADMSCNDDPVNGEIVQRSANEIMMLQEAGDRTYGNIIAVLLQGTDFIKSPSLQASMQSGFDPKTLSDGKTSVYVIIPVDKLKSHSRWLRLVVTTMMRAVVRNPGQRVTFLLDEFAALGYISEIEVALSTYAGYNITVWSILQSLIQLKALYGENWETFTGNSVIRQYFNINDNFTADYVSKSIGQTSNVLLKRTFWGIKEANGNSRALVTPDELRRKSGDYMFTFIGQLPYTPSPKHPYYEMPQLIDNGKPRYDENPYMKDETR